MNYFKKNWFKKTLLIAIIFVSCFIAFQANKYFQNFNNFQLQSKCSDAAEKFYVKNGWRKDGNDTNSSYENHFNLKLNKCFILLTSGSLNDDFVTIDLYDVLESKRYASYNGHGVCDKSILSLTNTSTNKCQVDSGNIWYDGNDARVPPDFTVGFRGLKYGSQVGDENTQRIFMEHVQPFMNN